MTETSALRLGTRGSLLATTQSRQIAELVSNQTGRRVELVIIRTEGDDVRVPLHAPQRPGVFVAALRDALLDARVDLVVHSFKDLPSAPLPGAVVAAVPERVDARDTLCARDGLRLADLPAGARVGTSSPRRAAGLLRVRPDLEIVPIRGNVDTRLAKVTNGEVDAVVLAAAGLLRVDRAAAVTEWLDPQLIVPAPAQGALAVECRPGSLEEPLAQIDHAASRMAVTAERAVLRAVEAACTTAIGAHASWTGDGELLLVAELTDHQGISYARASSQARVAHQDAADELGERVAAELLAG